MPELPLLEVLKDTLAERLRGRPVRGARALRPGILKTVAPPLDALVGRSVTGTGRRGKHLILSFGDELHLVMHLMLTGRLVFSSSGSRATKATGFVLEFEDGGELRLIEGGTTKRAGVHVVADPLDVERVASAGIEPLSPAFTVAALAALAAGRRRQAKKLLTDQREIAGIGSAYADEILFEAKLSPLRYVNRLSLDEVTALHRAVGVVLRRATEELRREASNRPNLRDLHPHANVYQRTGEPCTRCATPIAEIRYAQTRTYYCPSCQAGGRHLPDRRSWLAR